MPPKKKIAKTQEIPTETDTSTEQPENIQVLDEGIQKPKKKRELTQKQKDNFVKLQQANAIRYAEKKRLKEEALNNKIEEVEIKKVEVVEKEEEEEEEEKVIVKKKAPKKKKKQKIVIEEDSSSDSENEIIIRRSRGKSKKQQLHNQGYMNDLQLKEKEEKKEEPKKEEVKEEEQALNKKYSAVQILKAIGL